MDELTQRDKEILAYCIRMLDNTIELFDRKLEDTMICGIDHNDIFNLACKLGVEDIY